MGSATTGKLRVATSLAFSPSKPVVELVIVIWWCSQVCSRFDEHIRHRRSGEMDFSWLGTPTAHLARRIARTHVAFCSVKLCLWLSLPIVTLSRRAVRPPVHRVGPIVGVTSPHTNSRALATFQRGRQQILCRGSEMVHVTTDVPIRRLSVTRS